MKISGNFRFCFVVLLSLLVNQFASANSDLILAAERGTPEEILTILSKPNVDINYQEYNSRATALMGATEYRRLENVQLLIEKGANLDLSSYMGWTALMYASSNGYAAIAELIAKNGANLEIKNYDGLTALYLASSLKNKDTAKVLLKYGANVNVSGGGWTPLTQASYGNDFDSVQFLVSNGADVNLANYSQATALMYATHCWPDQLRKTEYLIANGADLNKQDMNGYSALMFASNFQELEIVKLLIARGADVNLRSITYKKTALGIALESGTNSQENREIIKILKQAGGIE